jgi:hypothetical protein
MLVVATWLWGSKYDASYVEKLFSGVRKHLRQPHRFLCMTERDRIANFSSGIERHAIKDPELTTVKGCFARLRMFDPGWQHNRNITDRLVSIDLDAVITGPLDVLFDRPGNFLILRGANASNPCPYNGSVFMLRAGAHSDVWSDFSLESAAAVPHDKFPDDQAWFWHKIPHASGWTCDDGIYAFGKPGWPKGDALPKDARIVAFPGWRDPAKFVHLDWVKQHWR